MGILNDLSEVAHGDLLHQDPKVFCKAIVSTLLKCDVIISNLAETFNFYICKAKTLPIIAMLEDIMISLMKRMLKKKKIKPLIRFKMQYVLELESLLKIKRKRPNFML